MTANSAAGESNDNILLDEPTTADLKAKVTEAWREFAGALAKLLPTLAPGARPSLPSRRFRRAKPRPPEGPRPRPES